MHDLCTLKSCMRGCYYLLYIAIQAAPNHECMWVLVLMCASIVYKIIYAWAYVVSMHAFILGQSILIEIEIALVAVLF